MIERDLAPRILAAAERFPAVTVTGTGGPVIVEVKAGQTVTADFIAPAVRIQNALEGATTRLPVVVYGGDTVQNRSNAQVVPWHAIPTIGT